MRKNKNTILASKLMQNMFTSGSIGQLIRDKGISLAWFREGKFEGIPVIVNFLSKFKGTVEMVEGILQADLGHEYWDLKLPKGKRITLHFFGSDPNLEYSDFTTKTTIPNSFLIDYNFKYLGKAMEARCFPETFVEITNKWFSPNHRILLTETVEIKVDFSKHIIDSESLPIQAEHFLKSLKAKDIQHGQVSTSARILDMGLLKDSLDKIGAPGLRKIFEKMLSYGFGVNRMCAIAGAKSVDIDVTFISKRGKILDAFLEGVEKDANY